MMPREGERPRRPVRLRGRAALALAALVVAAPAARAAALFSSDGQALYVESAAFPAGASPLRFNPATAGTIYPSELAMTFVGEESGPGHVAGSFESDWFRAALGGNEDDPLSFALGIAGGGGALRQGLQAAWVPRSDEGRATDWRYGLMSRPVPWASFGFVADHLGQPSLGDVRLDRSYDVGLGLRPFAWSRSVAHTLGTRLTLAADARWNESAQLSSAVALLSAEAEILPGIRLRGAYDTDTRAFQVGFTAAGVRARLDGSSSYDKGGEQRGSGWTVAAHGAEDRTVLAGRADQRVALVQARGYLGDESLAGFTIYGTTRTVAVGPLHRELDRALEDPLTHGVLLDIAGLGNMAQVEELRARIARLRAAGKPVVAYLESGAGRNGLYLAAACDRIVTSPEAMYLQLGLRAERRYLRKPLAELGVRIDRASVGRYKSAFREFSVDSTSDADRESIDHLLDTHQEMFVAAVTEGRHMDRARLMPLLDGRLWRSEDLRAAGLVDSVGYRRDALGVLGSLTRLGKKPHAVSLASRPPARVEWTVPGRIAVVYASGSIDAGSSGNDLVLGPYMGSETMTGQIERAFKNRDVRAVVLRIESGGGSGLASDLIYQAVMRAKQETGKPLIVSMGQSAASGGYLIALPGDRLFADRFTHTGSIGVIYARPSLQGFFNKHGARTDLFVRGEHMGAWSLSHDWDATEQALADSAAAREYRLFVGQVAAARRLEWADAERAAQGRVWMGDDAVKLRLVDDIGGLEAAVAEARKRAHIPKDEKIRLVEYRRPRGSWLQRATGTLVFDALEHSFGAFEPGEPLHWDGGMIIDE